VEELTMRQYQVFEGMADGLSVEDIATRYSMTIGMAKHTQSRVIAGLPLPRRRWTN
jgi:DNA-binding NarL/FixJ family response regulator